MKLTLSTNHANRGRSLEALVIASNGPLVYVSKIATGSRFIKDRRTGQSRTILTKNLVDYVGCVRHSGRMILFDCKQCDSRSSFPVGSRDHVTELQAQVLMEYGSRGAVAGLLVEGTAPELGLLAWLPWSALTGPRTASIAWDDPRWTALGDNKHAIRWEKLLEWV